MNTVEVTFAVPDWIASRVESQAYERVGAVIRDAQTKEVVTWLREVAPSLSQASKIFSQFGSVASIINLGVTAMGFALVMNRLNEIEQRLNEIEQRLKQTQKVVNRIERKIDISFYAQFRAALELAQNAFTMTKPENRMASAMLAIN